MWSRIFWGLGLGFGLHAQINPLPTPPVPLGIGAGVALAGLPRGRRQHHLHVGFLWGFMGFRALGFELRAQINPLPNLPVPLGIGALVSRWLGFRVGVADINVRGRVRAACKPLLNRVPLVGGVKARARSPWPHCGRNQ